MPGVPESWCGLLDHSAWRCVRVTDLHRKRVASQQSRQSLRRRRDVLPVAVLHHLNEESLSLGGSTFGTAHDASRGATACASWPRDWAVTMGWDTQQDMDMAQAPPRLDVPIPLLETVHRSKIGDSYPHRHGCPRCMLQGAFHAPPSATLATITATTDNFHDGDGNGNAVFM